MMAFTHHITLQQHIVSELSSTFLGRFTILYAAISNFDIRRYQSQG
ncbi:hypothetical protein PN436_03290 [Dolichospermum circinale CS-1031]|nr:hypothetical protein [Dolichospermum circinale CS-1031]